MFDAEILIAILEQQRNEAMSALAHAIARGEALQRRIAELEKKLSGADGTQGQGSTAQ